jgi:hypothetical protein
MPRWSASHLDAVQRAFDLLSSPPPALTLDPRTLPARTRTALPSRALTMNELKEILLAQKTTRVISDPVWRELVTRARRDGPAWVVGVTGLDPTTTPRRPNRRHPTTPAPSLPNGPGTIPTGSLHALWLLPSSTPRSAT